MSVDKEHVLSPHDEPRVAIEPASSSGSGDPESVTELADDNGRASGDGSSEDAASEPGTPEASAHSCGGTPKRRISERKLAANRANGKKSTGPRTEQGKQHSKLNGLKRDSTRLLGLVEWRTMQLPPGEAEILYQELVAPYQPVPPILAVHFQDFARLHLELRAWGIPNRSKANPTEPNRTQTLA